MNTDNLTGCTFGYVIVDSDERTATGRTIRVSYDKSQNDGRGPDVSLAIIVDAETAEVTIRTERAPLDMTPYEANAFGALFMNLDRIRHAATVEYEIAIERRRYDEYVASQESSS